MSSRVDLHIHSLSSDGTDTAGEIVKRVVDAGISIFALTDHDTAAGLEAVEGLIPDGVTFVPGIEFSCRAGSGKCHILGYGCDRSSEGFQKILASGESLRREKLEARIKFLDASGASLPKHELAALRSMPSAGKPHIANLLVKYGLSGDKKSAMDLIDRCPASSARLEAEPVVRGIISSGGVPVWAHPLGGEGEPETDERELEATLSELIKYGLAGLECFYSKYAYEKCLLLEKKANDRGLLVSGGSDYHGKNKNIALGTLNADGIDIPADRLTVLGRFMR